MDWMVGQLSLHQTKYPSWLQQLGPTPTPPTRPGAAVSLPRRLVNISVYSMGPSLLLQFDVHVCHFSVHCPGDTGHCNPWARLPNYSPLGLPMDVILVLCHAAILTSTVCQWPAAYTAPACLNVYQRPPFIMSQPASTLPAYPKCHVHHLCYFHHHRHCLCHCCHPSPVPAEPFYLPFYFSVYVIGLLFILKQFSLFLLPIVHLKYCTWYFYVLLIQFMYSLLFFLLCSFLHFLPMC